MGEPTVQMQHSGHCSEEVRWGEKLKAKFIQFSGALTDISDKMISWLYTKYIAPAQLSSTTYIACNFNFHKYTLHC